jgi:hypothetical protein
MPKDPEEVILALVEDKDLIFRFFAVFSRFECALKRGGFLKKQERAEADWDSYVNQLRGQFATVKAPVFKTACDYLTSKPPDKQIVSGNSLGWKATVRGNNESIESYVIRLVRTVRNNLFHGGKYPYPVGPLSDAGRDRRLIESALAVLEECLRLSPDVRYAFEEAA